MKKPTYILSTLHKKTYRPRMSLAGRGTFNAGELKSDVFPIN